MYSDKHGVVIGIDEVTQWQPNVLARLKEQWKQEFKAALDYLPNAGFESVLDPYFEGKFDEVFKVVYETFTYLENLVKKA